MARACTLLLFYIVLVCLSIGDFRKKKISNGYPVTILLLALIALFTIPEISVVSRVAGMFAASVPMSILAVLLPGSFGGGDVKLCFACGAFLGWPYVLEGTVIAVFLAGIYSLYFLFREKQKGNWQIAFGPFLSIGYGLMALQLF